MKNNIFLKEVKNYMNVVVNQRPQSLNMKGGKINTYELIVPAIVGGNEDHCFDPVILYEDKMTNTFRSLYEQFVFYVENFNLKETVEYRREDDYSYCEKYEFKESVNAFMEYEEYLYETLFGLRRVLEQGKGKLRQGVVLMPTPTTEYFGVTAEELLSDDKINSDPFVTLKSDVVCTTNEEYWLRLEGELINIVEWQEYFEGFRFLQNYASRRGYEQIKVFLTAKDKIAIVLK